MAVENQILALNMQLQEANAQIGLMGNALDALRNESGRAIQELRSMLAQASPAGGRSDKKEREISFISVKVFDGGKFSGSTKESLKAWSKKTKIFLNAQHRGMRKALEIVEEAATKANIADLGFDREFAENANEKLHDFLMTYTSEEALQVVEPFSGEGFEAWRQLKLRFTSNSGSTEVDRVGRMFTRKACKNMADLPAAIDWLDKELKRDEELTGHRQPDHTKIALLVRLFPEKDEKELKHRWVRNQKDFQRVRADILAVAVEERLELQSRGVKDMEVDAVEREPKPEEEESWTTKEWLEWPQEEEQLDYMGKGKGKGKGGGKGKGWKTPGQLAEGKGDGKGKGKGKGKETRICHYCQKAGHLIADCRSKRDGKPKAAKAISSLTEDWEEDCGSCQCDALNEDENSDSETSEEESGWTQTEEPKADEASRKLSFLVTTSPSTTASLSSNAPAVLDPWSSSASTVLDPWSAFRARSGVTGVIDHLSDEPAGETPISDVLRRRRMELQKKIDEMMGNTAATPVPTTPPGFSMQKRLKCQGGSKAHFANTSQPCCGSAASGTQTEVSLPHTMRDVLWTASSLDSVMDFEDDSASAIGEAHAAPSVLDIDNLEVAKYEDTDETDETDEVDDVANKIQENFRTPKKQKKKLQRQNKKIEGGVRVFRRQPPRQRRHHRLHPRPPPPLKG